MRTQLWQIVAKLPTKEKNGAFFGHVFHNRVPKGFSPYEGKFFEPCFRLRHSKMPRTPNLSTIVPTMFFVVSIRGPKFVKRLWENENLSGNCRSSNFGQLLDKFGPAWLEPEKQSLGQVLDKFGVHGILNAVRGKVVRKERQAHMQVGHVKYRYHMANWRSSLEVRCAILSLFCNQTVCFS